MSPSILSEDNLQTGCEARGSRLPRVGDDPSCLHGSIEGISGIDGDSQLPAVYSQGFKVSVNGGTITPLATGVAGLSGIGTDGTNLYFTQNGNSIVRMLTSGGPILPCIVGRAGVTGRIAVEPPVGPSFYWQEGNNIVRAAKTCGSVVPFLTRASITGLATDGIDLYWAESPGNISGTGGIVFSGSSTITSLAVGATNIAWISNTGPDLVLTKPKN